MVEADEIYATGWQLLQSRRFGDAAAKFELLTQKDADDHEALRALALVYVRLNRLEEAKLLLERAIELHDREPEYYTDLNSSSSYP